MSFTAGQIIAWKLVGNEATTVPTFETPAQAQTRMPLASKNVTTGDAEYTPAKANADARVARRQAGKES